MPHGVANAVLLPHVARYNLIANPEKFADIAEFMGENTDGLSTMDAAELAIHAIAVSLLTSAFRSICAIWVSKKPISHTWRKWR